MNGYAGKILHLDLSGKEVSAIPTSKYKSWVGGHGMGSAIFFDLVKDKITDDVARFLMQKTAKRPIVIPVLLGV